MRTCTTYDERTSNRHEHRIRSETVSRALEHHFNGSLLIC